MRLSTRIVPVPWGRSRDGRFPRIFAIAAVAAFLSSCASTVRVKRDEGQLTREGIESARILGRIATAPFSAVASFAGNGAGQLENARKLESRGRNGDAAAAYLKTAMEAHELLASGRDVSGSDAEKALLKVHNASLARFAELWIEDPRRLDPGPYRLTYGGQEFEIAMAPDSTYGRDYFDRFVAAESVVAKGMVRKTRDGYGAPVVGIREQHPGRAEEMKFYPEKGLHIPATLTMDSVGKTGEGRVRVTFSLRNPLLCETITVGRRSHVLAADFSAPLALLLEGKNEVAWGLEGFFKATKLAGTSGIYLTEPYDPDRIPVLLIHGLISVPIIWRDIIPEMNSEPDLAKRYQFMVFTYPSSYPLIESAKLLRDELEEVRGHFDPDGNDPLSRDLVVAGHSMGGMLTHTLVTEFGDNLWKQFSDRPFDSLPLDPGKKEEIRELVYFDSDPAVCRAVYFSVPHRGARMAEKGIAGLVSQAARLPGSLMTATGGFLAPRELEELGLKVSLDKKTTSIQSLRPRAPVVAAMDQSPYKPGVVYHSVIGDRGKGNTPNSSDGVVEYWSSHQPGAASELIVPTGHRSYKHPLAIAELKRILREHLAARR